MKARLVPRADHAILREIEAERKRAATPAPLRVNLSARDRELIHAIALRALHTDDLARSIVNALGGRNSVPPAESDTNRERVMSQVALDVTAVHANGYPLDLGRLLASERADFIEDLSDLMVNLDRSTGKLAEGVALACAKERG